MYRPIDVKGFLEGSVRRMITVMTSKAFQDVTRLGLSLVERFSGLEDERDARPTPILDEKDARRESWTFGDVAHSIICCDGAESTMT